MAKLVGSQQARRRLQVILETLSGSTRVQHACAELGIGVARFHQLRLDALQGAVEQLELRPAGRPAAPPADPRIAVLEARIEELKLELQAAQTREEIALVLPRLHPEPATEGTPGKKPPRRRKSRRRQQQQEQQES
ncbi:MAG TPA: hypothetical protein VNX47_07695 [Nevskia sp.]|nr:hypothetical protein [Nevskia sp.]